MLAIIVALMIVSCPGFFLLGVFWERHRESAMLASVAAKALEDHEEHASIHPIPYRPDQRRQALGERIEHELRWKGVL